MLHQPPWSNYKTVRRHSANPWLFSRPAGKSLNDYAIHENVYYQTLDDVRELVKPVCWMARVALARAYHCMKLHSNDYYVTEIAWTFSG